MDENEPMASTKTSAHPGRKGGAARVPVEPKGGIAYVVKEFGYCRDRVAKWKQDHDALIGGLWAWEDLVEKAGRLFDRILELDDDLQGQFLRRERPFDAALAGEIAALMPDWLVLAQSVLQTIKPVEDDYGSVRGAPDLRVKVDQARAMLTPDPLFVAGDTLARLRDEAIEEHRAGRTEPMASNAAR